MVQFHYNYYWGELPFDAGYELRDYYPKTYPRLRPEHLARVPRPATGFSHIRTQAAPSLPNDDELADLAPELQALCEQLAPEDWREVYHATVTELTGESDLGGYAQ